MWPLGAQAPLHKTARSPLKPQFFFWRLAVYTSSDCDGTISVRCRRFCLSLCLLFCHAVALSLWGKQISQILLVLFVVFRRFSLCVISALFLCVDGSGGRPVS